MLAVCPGMVSIPGLDSASETLWPAVKAIAASSGVRPLGIQEHGRDFTFYVRDRSRGRNACQGIRLS